MNTFPTGTASILGRCVSAEIRARMGAQRVNQRQLASGAGFTSHNYVSIRLRDEKPFTLDDVEQIAEFFGDEPEPFIKTAVDRQLEEVWDAQGAALTAAAIADRDAAAVIDEVLKGAKRITVHDQDEVADANSPRAVRDRARAAREAELDQNGAEPGEAGHTA